MLSRMSKISVAASEDEPVVPQFEIGGLLLPQVEPIAYGRKPDMRARQRRCNRASVQMLDPSTLKVPGSGTGVVRLVISKLIYLRLTDRQRRGF